MAAVDGVRGSTSSDLTLSESLALQDVGDVEGQTLLGDDRRLSRAAAAAEAAADTEGAASTTNYEYGVSARVKIAFLVVYLALNMTLTLHSKSILEQIHCPWSLTTLHATFSSLGCGALYATGRLKLTRLTMRDNLVLVAFSFLFTINIAISIVSLSMVSVPFHQTIRASTPFFTVAAYRLLFGREYSFWTRISLIPIVVGVGAATYGDMDFTTAGLVVTFLGVMLATAKTITTNRLLTGTLKLPALELLLRMSPLAALQALAFALIAGEGRVVTDMVANNRIEPTMFLSLFANGCIALLLNITSFQTNKLAGALTLTVSANVKQILTILLGIFLFNVHINMINGMGMVVTAAGAAWFSSVELMSKKQQQQQQQRQQQQEAPPILHLPTIEPEKIAPRPAPLLP